MLACCDSDSSMRACAYLVHHVPHRLHSSDAHAVALVCGQRQQRGHQLLAGGAQAQPQQR